MVSFLRRRWKRIALAVVLAPVVIVLVMALFTSLPPELRESPAPSMRVLARNGHLLREVRTEDGARARPLPLSAFPADVRNAVLAAEDRGFYGHHGVDLFAVVRAAISNVMHARIVSGASTITMQLARTLRPHRRSLWGKLVEVSLALRIEASLSKDEILEQYLNRVIYGPNVRGYAAAASAYLGTPPESLSLAECALLAGLPRGPSLYALDRRPELARRRRDRVLARMAESGMIDAGQLERAQAERIVVAAKPAFGAPHLVRAVVSGAIGSVPRGAAEVTTTIDPELQRIAESAVTTTLADLAPKHVSAASVVVLDNATGDILAWVGSPGFFDDRIGGQNDGVLALRQPGSSLKPFVYAEAMATFGWTPATMLPDVELHIPLPGGGDYVPHDYDGKLRGPVRLREALGSSLNVPAVAAIQRVGTQATLERLRAFGFTSLKEEAEHYGPALALGDGEVTLLALTNAYSALARGGLYRDVRPIESVDGRVMPVGETRRVLDERTAAMVTDVLRDRAARLSAFGDQNVLELDVDVAAKTGTSKGYRDNVAVGFTRAVTVGVWAGNFDGSPMQDVSGITGAGPIFHTVMEAAARMRPAAAGSLTLARDAARLGLAATAVCALSGEVATAACPHRIHEYLPADAAEHAPPCAIHERVRLDRRNGLLAGPDCAESDTETRVLERWPAQYTDWAARMSRARVPESSSPHCPIATEAASGVRVTQPFDGGRFVLDPDRPAELQRLELRALPADAEILVDDVPLPSDHTWVLAAGAHVARARAHGEESLPVHFTVR